MFLKCLGEGRGGEGRGGRNVSIEMVGTCHSTDQNEIHKAKVMTEKVVDQKIQKYKT